MSGLEEALGLADGCPNCVRNVEPPRSAVPVSNGWRCAYLCVDCGHAWTTDWAAESLVLRGNQPDSESGKWEDWGTSKDGPRASMSPAVCAAGGDRGPRRTNKEFD
jgi:hypothetical protein